jgi:hypothetical protein
MADSLKRIQTPSRVVSPASRITSPESVCVRMEMCTRVRLVLVLRMFVVTPGHDGASAIIQGPPRQPRKWSVMVPWLE